MSSTESPAELLAHIDKTLVLLQRVHDEYRRFLAGDLRLLGRKNTTAIVIAELMVDYYTCLETLFLRISQYFENHLDQKRWHADLLERMTLHIEGVRHPVVSDETARHLGELMKFRHFRRYYFELEYDWDKLEYLQKVLERVAAGVPADLGVFRSFVLRLI
ncbi:MAG: hypothetical protein AB1505_31685 [Candidatus Latescibacterota bacterium]